MMSTTHPPKGKWCVGVALGTTCVQVAKVTIDMEGAIPLMGGKDEVRGGNNFHDVIITIEDGVIGGRETT